MRTINITSARNNLFSLVSEAASSHSPIHISGKKHNAVLLSEEDWEAIQETIYLLSIPNMRESIIEGMDTPIEECSTEPDW